MTTPQAIAAPAASLASIVLYANTGSRHAIAVGAIAVGRFIVLNPASLEKP